jgi:hypothetical protein
VDLASVWTATTNARLRPDEYTCSMPPSEVPIVSADSIHHTGRAGIMPPCD